MHRPYRAVPLDILSAPDLEPHRLRADSDFDALTRMKDHYGADLPFVLWQEARRVLVYQPASSSAAVRQLC